MSRLIVGKKVPGEEELTNRDPNQGRLLFTRYRERDCAFLLRGDQLLAVEALPQTLGRIGSIHIGKVKNVVKNIDACFVEIADKELCFLPMKEARFPFLINRKFDGRILEGDELLLQVTTDAQKTKQAAVTAHISLANDGFAICIGSDHIGFSGKLEPQQKSFVRSFLEEEGLMHKGHFIWEGYGLTGEDETVVQQEITEHLLSVGLIVRTLSGSMDRVQLQEALLELLRDFRTLLRESLHRTCFSCLKEAPAACEAVLQSIAYAREYQEIVTDDEHLYSQLAGIVPQRDAEASKRLRLYQDPDFSLSKLYSLERRMDEALGARVWLKSGGYLVIEPTEAMTVIDVNSGKYDVRKTSAQMAWQINREAALEVVRQLRLRNLSGIIIVDFINMAEKEQEMALLELLREQVKGDRQKVHVVDITPLGLVEITRKKELPPLREQLKF